jgi:hypothetical protein
MGAPQRAQQLALLRILVAGYVSPWRSALRSHEQKAFRCRTGLTS